MPLCLGSVGLGAAEEEAPVGDVGVARPHLLAVHDVLVAALARRACGGPARSEPAPGSEKPWHQSSVAVHHRARGSACAAPRVPCWSIAGSDEVDVGLRGRAGRAELVEGRGRRTSARRPSRRVRLRARPRDRGPAAVGQHALPVARDLDPHRVLDARPAVVAAPASSGRFASSQARASSRNARSLAGEREVHRAGDPSRPIRGC